MYSNGKSPTFSFDPDITERGVDTCGKCSLLIISANHWDVDGIICSPYFRARRTASLIQHGIFQLRGKIINITYSSQIGEYLGNWTNITPDCFRDETFSLNVIYPETFEEMKYRAQAFARLIRGKRLIIITHGVIAKEIANELGYKFKHEIPNAIPIFLK